MTAAEASDVNWELTAPEIGRLLVELVGAPARSDEAAPLARGQVTEPERLDRASRGQGKASSTPSEFSCPDCGGVLNEVHEDGILRFRCRVGHAYGADSLLNSQGEKVEDAIWVGIRALEERVSLLRRMARRMTERGYESSAKRFTRSIEEAEEHAAFLRRFLSDTALFEPPDLDAPVSPSFGESDSSQEERRRYP
jgi:two-component system chemotaxis response regulator CheB